MLYSYTFANRKRDLSDVLSTVVKDEPRFISNFRPVSDATSRKHEWLEDQLVGRGIVASAISEGVLTVSPADRAKVRVGTLISVKDDPALFLVSAATDTTLTVTLAAANGSELTVATLPASNVSFIIVSTPMGEASVNGDGEENYASMGSAYNTTQIFRKEIVISGSALAVASYGNIDNLVNRQTALALADLARDLNRVALFGRRVEANAATRGEAGGLYAFAADNSINLDADGAVLDSYLINDAAQAVLAEGGDPVQVLCSPGQARVISNEYKERLQIMRSDDRRGAYVAMIVNEINGRGLTVLADPDVPDTDAWIIDPAGLGMASLTGRAISDVDATPQGFDGIRRVALGELTFEFKNIRQRACRISGLQGSAAAIAAMRANA